LDHLGGLAVLPLFLTAAEEWSAVRSRIEGEWTGWDGSTVVTLVDGSVWQQDEYYYRYQGQVALIEDRGPALNTSANAAVKTGSRS
jgi:hypothetical protein